MSKFILLLWILVLFLGSSVVVAANTININESHSNNILIPNKGLIFHVPEGVTAELSGVISGKGPLIKQGKGTLVLSGENTYQGDTLVEAGLLRATNAKALNTKTGTIFVKGDGLEGSSVIESTVDLAIGLVGELNLVVTDGGKLYTIAGKYMIIGMGANTRISVRGTGSEIRSGASMIIAQSGKVDFGVINGAKVIATNDLVINQNNAEVSAYISGLGTQLLCYGNMYLGYSGHTEIKVEIGALVQTAASADENHDIYLAYEPQSETKVYINGGKTKLISGGNLVVGYSGNANLDVRNKGQITFKNTVFIGYTKTGRGVTRLTGYGCVLSDYVQLYDINGHITGLVKNPPIRPADIDDYNYDDDYAYYDEDYDYVEDPGYPEDVEEGVQSKHKHSDSLPELSIIAGFGGYGELHVNRGARINIWGNIYAGYYEGAKGIIQASGNKAELKVNSNIYIGYYGNGELLFEAYASIWDYDEYHAENVYMAYEQGSTAKVDINRSFLKVNNETFVGCCGHAVLNITGGVLESDVGLISAGVCEHGKAEINISGQGSRLLAGSTYDDNKQGFLIIGNNGEAVVNVENGGEIHVRGHIEIGLLNKGIVNLKGSHTSLQSVGEMIIGHHGYGELNVLDGAMLFFWPDQLARYIFLGYSTYSTGVLNIDKSVLEIRGHKRFYLGYHGKGVLNITNGGVFDGTTSMESAYYQGSEAILNVSGQGSKLAMSIILGYNGKAYATINDGGLLSAGYGISMSYEKGYSEMLVDNARVDCRSLLVGYKKPAVLNVVNDSHINISEDFEIARSSGEATVNVSNSKINVANNLTMSLSGNGALNILAGGEVSVGVDIKVTIFRGHGSITVDGPGAVLSGGKHFKIGVHGNADMSILNGGVVKIAWDVPVVDFGLLTIDGEGSTLFAGRVIENEEDKAVNAKLTNGGKITIVERDHEADRRNDLQEKAFFLFSE